MTVGRSRPDARWRPTRLPPGGHAIGARTLIGLWRQADAADPVAGAREALGSALAGRRIALYGSGRAALAAVFAHLREASGRAEAVLPAYCCYSVPAAAVAAGLRVRLVDVDARGRIDVDALARTPLDEACAVVVGNLFGLAEPVDRIAAIASAAGCALVDDAAQAFGASDASGPVGGRGDVGVLSFGRGKPLSALGGGALAWPPEREPGLPAPAVPAPRPGRAAVRALAWDAALQPAAFRALAAVPALHIGETVFDPAIRPDPIDGAAAALLPVAVARAAADAARRRDAAGMLAARIASATAWVPLLADSGTVGVYPRLGLLGPDATARDAALVALTRVGAGASRLYPRSLDGLPALGPHLVDPTSCPGARGLAARVLTLPTHGALRGRRLDEVLDILSAPSRS